MFNTKTKKTLNTTMNSYSGNNKYTQTLFHYPTKYKHSSSYYEAQLSNRPIKTFRKKAKAECHSLMYESALNPFARTHKHYEQGPKITGDRKKQVAPFSAKQTDPITLSYEYKQREPKITKKHEATIDYKKDIQRKNYLPIERQYSTSRRHYHSQLGYSLSARQSVAPRSGINESPCMRSTIQYTEHKQMNRPSVYDNFKYSSKK